MSIRLIRPIRLIFRWLTASRRRKILSATLAVLMLLTSIRFIFIKPTPVSASDVFIKFDEGYGTSLAVNDSNGTVSPGSITNAVWRTEDMCKVGKCLYFDGTGDYVSFPDHDSLDMAAADEVTINLWFRTGDITSGTRTLISKYETTGADGGYQIYMNSSGQIVFGIDSDNSGFPLYSVTTPNSYDDNHWHFVSAVKNGPSSMSLYIDAMHQATTAITSTDASNNDTFYIGIDNALANGWLGFIDEVKVMRTARTANQIKTDYAGQTSERGTAASFGPDQSYLSDGLVGYWKMDEGSDGSGAVSRMDSSGNGFTLTDNNTVPSAAGKFNRSSSFTAANQEHLSRAHTSGNGLDITGSLTISAWININSTSNSDCAGVVAKVDNNSGSNGQYFFGNSCYGGKNLRFGIFHTNDSHTDLQGDTDLDNYLNEWIHIVGVFDSNQKEMRIYLNGTLDKEPLATLTSSAQSTSAPFWIGRSYGGNFYFDGRIDEARVYNRALTPAEVRQLYEWAPGPVGYWKMDEGTGTTAYDSSGNGNTGTLTNSPSWTAGKFGSALSFNGSDNYIAVPDPGTGSLLDFTTNDSISISSWVYLNSPPTSGEYYTILTKGETTGSTNSNYSLYIKGGSPAYYLCFGFESSGWIDWCTDDLTSVVQAGKWYHIVAQHTFGTTHSDIIFNFFINGAWIEAPDIGADLPPTLSNDPLWIGANDWDGYVDTVFDGKIDDIKIYRYIRTPAQIIQDMNAGHPAPGSPVGSALIHYKLDEGYGTTANNSGNAGSSLDGTITGATWTNEGKFGKALSFDGSGDYIQRADTSAIDFSSTLTLSGWFYPQTSNASKALIVKDTAYRLVTNASGQPLCQIYASAAWQTAAASNAALPLNQWSHVLCTYDQTEGQIRVYVNGVQTGSQSQTNTINNSSAALRVASDTSATYDDFEGIVDEIKLYNIALTASQVPIEMNQGMAQVWGASSTDSTGAASNTAVNEYCPPGHGSTCSPPVAEWKFDENIGDYAYDTSGNGYTGTLTGGPLWSAGKYSSGLLFNGSSQHVDVGTGPTSVKSVEFWVKPTTTTEYFINLTSNTDYIWSNSGTVTATGFSDPTIYVNGTESTTITAGQWNHVVVTSATAENASNLDIGRTQDTNYLEGIIDNVRLFSNELTQAQVSWLYNRGGPVGWWKFDECSGTTAHDASENANHGTITIGASGTQTAVGTCTSGNTAHAWYNGRDGKFNSSLSFDGTDDIVDLGDQDIFSFSDGTNDRPFVISAWVYVNNATAADIFSKSNVAEGSEYRLFVNNHNDLRGWVTSPGGNMTVEAIDVIEHSVWNHLVFVYDGSGLADGLDLYVNGNKPNLTKSTGGTYTAMTNTSAKASIGARWNADSVINALNGQIDDVRIYNYALTEHQIRTVMNSGAIRF